MPLQTELNISKTLAATQLGIDHGYGLRPIAELPGFRTLPRMIIHDMVKNMSRVRVVASVQVLCYDEP